MRTGKGGGVASPPWPARHHGPVLVCGNAWCLHDDVERARKIYPDAAVIAVNGASREIEAFALFSQHPERFVSHRWIEWQRKRHEAFTVHGCKFRPDMPWVDHWWEDARGGGSSAWGARKVAGLMGFDPVILCGAPLLPGNYAGHRPGVLMTDDRVVSTYRAQIEKDADWHIGCYSMSGWTRDQFGEPRQ